MLRNAGLRFRCEHVHVKVERTDTPFTVLCTEGQVLKLPIAHGEGNYYAAPEVIKELEASDRIVFRYASPEGEVNDGSNPNGSVNGIAGICSEQRNVVGLMPHPERACEHAMGSSDGLLLFESVVKSLATQSALQAVGE